MTNWVCHRRWRERRKHRERRNGRAGVWLGYLPRRGLPSPFAGAERHAAGPADPGVGPAPSPTESCCHPARRTAYRARRGIAILGGGQVTDWRSAAWRHATILFRTHGILRHDELTNAIQLSINVSERRLAGFHMRPPRPGTRPEPERRCTDALRIDHGLLAIPQRARCRHGAGTLRSRGAADPAFKAGSDVNRKGAGTGEPPCSARS